MRHLFKYVALAIVIASVIGDAIRVEYHPYDESVDKKGLYIVSAISSESDFCLSRHQFTAPHTQVLAYDRKTDFIHQHNFEFVKEGAVCNVRMQCTVLVRYINKYSSLTEPAHILAMLRRLII